jgi:hypothetical protein
MNMLRQYKRNNAPSAVLQAGHKLILQYWHIRDIGFTAKENTLVHQKHCNNCVQKNLNSCLAFIRHYYIGSQYAVHKT